MKEIWKDLKDFEGKYQISNLENMQHADKTGLSNHRGKIKKVAQLDLEGNTINGFDSLSDAGRYIGVKGKPVGITKVCKETRKTAYDYKWQYTD